MNQTPEETLALAKLAFEEGQKGLADQDQTISSIRQRSIWIGGLAGVIASFLGREALKVTPLNPLSCSIDSIALLSGFVALCAVYISIFYIVRPRGNLCFHNSPSEIIGQFIKGEHATDLTATYIELAGFSEENYKNNDKVIAKLFKWLLFSAAAMFFEFAAWIIVLA
jgi:hypothetical protein